MFNEEKYEKYSIFGHLPPDLPLIIRPYRSIYKCFMENKMEIFYFMAILHPEFHF